MNELIRRVDQLERDLRRLTGSLRLTPKSNHSALGAPGVSDDEDAGYQVGSLWTESSTDTAYICTDASSGAAVWVEIT
jgi:hypothetical protein